MPDPVIRVENLSKKYRLGVINRQALVDQIESWVSRKLGRPDPHASIFEGATDRMPTPYDFWALKDVTFEIKKGDIVGIMGRNGSGKSTLLKILSRITAPTNGTAKLRGRVASLLEVGTGFNYELTGKENVYLNGSILGLKQREIDDRYERICEFAEISEFMETPVKRYSSGMRVRLAFAVAAHLDPEILILDEVLSVGDAKFQEKCLDKIEAIKSSGVTILFVSHSSQSVLKLCNKGILLDKGVLVAQGTATEVTEHYLNSLHLQSHDNPLPGYPESRVGLQTGQLAEIFLQNLSGGRLVCNIPVETSEGIFVIDLGWIRQSRLRSLRTEPSWSAAPCVCVVVVSHSKSQTEAESNARELLRHGASEVWIILPDGTIDVHRPPDATPMIPGLYLLPTET